MWNSFFFLKNGLEEFKLEYRHVELKEDEMYTWQMFYADQIMSATDHLQVDRLSHSHEIQEKCWKLYIIGIFHRSEINYLDWWTPEEMLEKLLKFKKNQSSQLH